MRACCTPILEASDASLADVAASAGENNQISMISIASLPTHDAKADSANAR
jgi:hypothetical protein